MGAVTGMLGLGGGSNGTGSAKPQGVNLPATVTSAQLNTANQQYQDAQAGQTGLLQALKAQNGLQNQSNVYDQLQGVASGQGPNPAQAQYYQNVQALANQQSGAISSIKGISPALAARMISQQGSSAMQNAAAAGGANLANQQLGALSAAGNMATTQAGQQIGQTNTNAQTALSEQQSLMNALNGQNNNVVGMQSNLNSANAGIAQAGMKNQAGALGSIANGIGGVTGLFADGGPVGAPMAGPQSRLAQHLASSSMASGGKVDALVSPGELYIPPGNVGDVLRGKNPLSAGEVFPGKPKVAGNSYANDTLPRKLDVGGVVVPNSVMQSKNPAKGARDMVSRVMAKKKARR